MVKWVDADIWCDEHEEYRSDCADSHDLPNANDLPDPRPPATPECSCGSGHDPYCDEHYTGVPL
jgi:hypothetical protein